MEQKRGNISTRGTFSRQRTQQTTTPYSKGPTGNSLGPTGAVKNHDLMPVGGFQGRSGQGRNRAMLNRGAHGNRGNFENYAGVQQNNQHQTSSNYNNPTNQRTPHRGQGGPAQMFRNRGNTQQYNMVHGDGQGTSYGTVSNVYSTYQPGPYGDIDQFAQVPWNQGQNVPGNASNTRMATPYTDLQTSYNNDFNGQQFTNPSFSAHRLNTGFHPQNMMVNSRGGMNQVLVGAGYQGNANQVLVGARYQGNANQVGYQGNANQVGYQGNASMLPPNSWMNENSHVDNEWNDMGSYETGGLNGDVAMDTTTSRNIEKNQEPIKKWKAPMKTPICELQKSLHLLTGDISEMKHWNMFKDSIQMMFQFVGQLDSAVSRGQGNSKEFLVKDEKNNTVKCVFYEIDRQIPKLTRGQWYRIVGTFDSSKELFNCLSSRQMLPGEANLMYVLSKKSSEVMKKMTMNIREL